MANNSQNLGLGILEEKTGAISETSRDESPGSASESSVANPRSELRASNQEEEDVMRKLMGNKSRTIKPAIEEID